MTTITRDQSKEITEMIEDTVEYLCRQMFENGTPMSGETIYKVISCYSETKLHEFSGGFTD